MSCAPCPCKSSQGYSPVSQRTWVSPCIPLVPLQEFPGVSPYVLTHPASQYKFSELLPVSPRNFPVPL